MIRIGILSDTHSFLDPKLKRFFSNCDEIWHAGDIGDQQVLDELSNWKKVRAVYGNIDGAEIRKSCPEFLHFELEGVKVFMIHIGGRPPRNNPRTRELLAKYPVDLFICGHSHILLVKKDETRDLMHINPGAAGRHGFHKVRTAFRLVLDAGEMKELELLELGPRAYSLSSP